MLIGFFVIFISRVLCSGNDKMRLYKDLISSAGNLSKSCRDKGTKETRQHLSFVTHGNKTMQSNQKTLRCPILITILLIELLKKLH